MNQEADQKLSSLVKVFSLPDWENQDKPDKDWFLYEKDGWKVLKTTEESNTASWSESPEPPPWSGPSSPGEQASLQSELDAVNKNARWRNPNPSGQAIYASTSKNIFLRLQEEPIKNYTAMPMREVKFNKSLMTPTDPGIQPNDSKYLTHFLTEVPRIIGCDRFFPSAIPTIFQQSLNQPILRETILAVSSWLLENSLGCMPRYTHQRLQRIIPALQNAINDKAITSEHICSVTFLSWLALISGDLQTAHRRLRELFLMLETAHIAADGSPLHEKPDPMVMFLYRMAFKIDNTLAYRNFPQVFPPPTDHDCYHRQWLSHFIPNQEGFDACLTSFKLDDFTNRITHLCREADQLPGQSGMTTIENGTTAAASKLVIELEAWRSLPMLQKHIPIVDEELFSSWDNVPSDTQVIQRIEQSSCQVGNDTLFPKLLIIHASLLIHLSIVIHEKLGPVPGSRVDAAVEICQIFASMSEDALSPLKQAGESRLLNALWLAGLVLDKHRYPLAFQWIENSLLDLDRGRGYRAASKLAHSLNEIWSQQDIHPGDAWEIVGRIFEDSWRAIPQPVDDVFDTDWR